MSQTHPAASRSAGPPTNNLDLGEDLNPLADATSTLAALASAVAAPLKRLAHRPWLQNLNDGDQEDFFEYHNPTLALIGPRDAAH